MKNVPIGIKNESNYYRNSEIEKISPKYIPSNNISFQDHLFIPAIEAPIPLSLAYRNRILSKDSTLIHRWFFIPAYDYVYRYHTIATTKNLHPYSAYFSIIERLPSIIGSFCPYFHEFYYISILFLFSILISPVKLFTSIPYQIGLIT